MHQDIRTSDCTGGQQNLLANIDGGDGATPGPGELYTGSSEVAVEKDLGDCGVSQDVEIWARRQRVYVSGA